MNIQSLKKGGTLFPICLIIIGIIIFASLNVKADVVYKLLTDENGITWQYGYNEEEKLLDVSFFESENNITEITIPDKNIFMTNDSDITEVTEYSFSNYENHNLGEPKELESEIEKIDLSNVDIVNGIKPLSNNTNVTEIILNPISSKIGYDVFREMKINIQNLDKVTEILGGAFYNTTFSNTNISLPNLRELGSGSFEKSNIATLSINSPIIGISAFKNCYYLKSVNLLDDVTQIYASAFENDANLTSFNFNHVKTIGNDVFKNCTSWNIDIKNTEIETLGTGVFWGTTGFVKKVTIPKNVKYLLWRTFAESNISGVDLNNVTVVGPEAFKDCRALSDINFGKTEIIEYRAFMNDANITTLSLSSSVYEIRSQAFDNCNIQNLNLGNVQKIDYGAFANNRIVDLYLPKSLSSMNTASIWYNNPIKKITIAYDTLSNQINALWVLLNYDPYNNSSAYRNPDNNGSKYLETIELVAPYSNYQSATINSKFGARRQYYPNECSSFSTIKDDKQDEYWANKYKNVLQSNYLNNLLNVKEVIIGEGYEYIGGKQFSEWNSSNSYKDNLKRVQLPSTLKGIGNSAFFKTFRKNSRPSINLPSSLEFIGTGAFLLSDGFTNDINLPNLNHLGSYAFEYSGITGITYGNNLTYIGHNTANMTPYLKKIILDCDFYYIVNNNGYSYSDYAGVFTSFFPTKYSGFDYNDTHDGKYNLIKFTENVKSYPVNTRGYGAFFNIDVATMDLGASKITDIGNNSFQESKIGTLTLPHNLTRIGGNAFLRTEVTNPVEIPNSITEFDYNAFMSADLYASNNLPSSLKKIGNYALFDTVYNKDLIIPEGVTDIGLNAFNGGSNGYHKHLNLTRNSAIFLNPLNATVTHNQPIHVLFRDSTLNELTFGNNVTELPSNSLPNGTPEFAQMNVKKITLNNIKKIPNYAFLECKNLEEVDMSKAAGLNEFGKYSFIDTPYLKKVSIRQGLDLKIGGYAFMRSGLKSIGNEYSSLDLNNNNVELDGTFIFSYMPNLEDVSLIGKINNGILPKGTFYRNPKLETVVLDHNFTEIGTQTFAANPNLKSLVMYGDTAIANNTNTQKLELKNLNSIDFYANTNKTDFTIQIIDADNGNTTISYNDFVDREYEYNKNATLSSVTLITSDDIFLDNEYGSSVTIRDISDDTMTIDSHANIYCYLKNDDCKTYNDAYKEYKTANNSDLYYLDEVLYLDANKSQLDIDENNNISTKDLTLYALRRDGIILLSSEWKKMTDVQKYVDSGLTIADYNANTTDPQKKVFNTTIPVDKVDVKTNDNFENISYTITNTDTDTGKIDVKFKYVNKVTNSTADTTLITNGNTVRVIYSDGCGGQAFANLIFDNLLVGTPTPVFNGNLTREGYEFIGWDKEITDKVTGNTIYTAKWKKIEYNYPPPSKDPVINPVSGNTNIININPPTLNNIIFVLLILILVSFVTIRINQLKKK